MSDNELLQAIDKRTTRLEAVLLGIEGAQDKGLVGEVQQMRKILDTHCAKTDRNSWKKWGAAGLGFGVGLTGFGTALAKLLGL